MLKILVVDDDINILDILGEMVVTLGHDVVIAKTYDEAINAIHKEQFDIVISDLLLNEVYPSGYDLSKFIREHYPKIRTIAMSSYISEADALECMRASFSCIIQKPIKLERLAELFTCLTRCKGCWERFKNGEVEDSAI